MVNFSPNPGPTPDAELLDALSRGDTEAFTSLYERHSAWVYRLAYRFTGNEADALDALQEVFAYILKKTPRLMPHVKLTTYLYPVTKNISMTLLRKRGKTVSSDAASDAILSQMAAPETARQDASRAELAIALQGLSDGLREVLLMRFVDGMSLGEIAEALEIPRGTVKSRLHNGVAKLRADARLRRYFEA